MPPAVTYQPTADQLLTLRSLIYAPRYLIIRKRAWLPVLTILPVVSESGLRHLLADLDQRGEHAQLVTYRPDEEDLGPFEPNPWPIRLLEIAIAVLFAVAIWLLTRWRY